MTTQPPPETPAQFIERAKAQGFALYRDIDAILPATSGLHEVLDEILAKLANEGIEVVHDSPVISGPRADDGWLDGIDFEELRTEEGGESVIEYLRELMTVPELNHDEQIAILRQIRNGETDREFGEKQVIEPNLRLVVRAAKDFRDKGLAFLDVLQQGNIGLMYAVRRYDSGRPYTFTTFATCCIRRAIMVGLHDHTAR